MVYSTNFKIVNDTKRGKLFQDIKNDKYYQLDNKNEKFAIMFKNCILNSVSLCILVGYFLNLSYILWIVIGLSIYITYTVFFNYKILPSLNLIKMKHIKVLDEKKVTNNQSLLMSLGFIVVGLGLIFCIISGEVLGKTNKIVVTIFSFFSLAMGIKQILTMKRYSKGK
ncbi:MAG: hypothetical protein RR734_03770 [Bacilli bacterium]